MAASADADSNEVVFTLNLQDIFDCDEVEIQQVSSEDIPEEVLNNIINEEIHETPEKNVESDGIKSVADNSCPPKNSRFRPLTNEEVDAIGSNSVGKKTHKQFGALKSSQVKDFFVKSVQI